MVQLGCHQILSVRRGCTEKRWSGSSKGRTVLYPLEILTPVKGGTE